MHMVGGNMKIHRIFIVCLFIITFIFLWASSDLIPSNDVVPEIVAEGKVEPTPRLIVRYISFDVPNVNSSFKTYMDYRAITNKNSSQYKFIKQWAWSDCEGFMRCNGEKDLGIDDNYYLIALGSYYGTEIGTKYRITLDTGQVFYGVLADCKADAHTNITNQYGKNKDIVEFLVDTERLNKDVKYHGSANVYMSLNGSIRKIERIDFIN